MGLLGPIAFAVALMNNAESLNANENKQKKRKNKIKKKEKDDDNSIASINTRMYFSSFMWWTACFFCFMFLFLVMFGDKPYLILNILFFVGGIVCLRCGIISYKKIKEKFKYIELIIVRNKRDIYDIAKILKEDVEVVIEDVSYIIGKGYIENCYIDNDKTIVIKNGK